MEQNGMNVEVNIWRKTYKTKEEKNVNSIKSLHYFEKIINYSKQVKKKIKQGRNTMRAGMYVSCKMSLASAEGHADSVFFRNHFGICIV